MEIPEGIIDMVVKDVIKELEDASIKAGKEITFDDIEGKMLEVQAKTRMSRACLQLLHTYPG